ncbi:MAG: DCC1-like thiol-disulfide oxidoreductase family protein [Thermodesulfobacteriota bacterium]|jgi:predicted DCC family thiol-disulfide oxidoreductase YuxK
MAPQYWLFWDGSCGLCRRTVAWVKRRDTANKIRAVPYQEAPRPPMTDELAHRCERAVHVLTPQGELLAAGRASLCVLGLIGYPCLARVWSVPPLVWFVEFGYWLVARNRRFFSRFLFRSPPRREE